MRCRHSGAEYDGQLGEATQHEPVAASPVQFGPLASQAEPGEAPDERSQGHLALQTGQRSAEAVVDPVPECQVAPFGPLNIELLGFGESATVAVRDGQADDDLRPDRDHVAADRDLLDGVAEG